MRKKTKITGRDAGNDPAQKTSNKKWKRNLRPLLVYHERKLQRTIKKYKPQIIQHKKLVKKAAAVGPLPAWGSHPI